VRRCDDNNGVPEHPLEQQPMRSRTARRIALIAWSSIIVQGMPARSGCAGLVAAGIHRCPGRGVSRSAGKERERAFYGVGADARAFADFIV
jgi:hypothetical protein